MLNHLQTIIDLSSTLLAMSIGLLAFRNLTRFHRFIFYQVVCYLVVDVLAYALSYYADNSWLYNLFIPVETILQLMAVSTLSNTFQNKKPLWVLLAIFLAVYGLDVFYLMGFFHFTHHAAIAEGILLSGLSAVVLYTQFLKNSGRPDWSVSLICIGHLVYFACSVPYLSILFYFQKLNPGLNQSLFQHIIVVLAWLRYLLIAIAFYKVRKMHPQKIIVVHD